MKEDYLYFAGIVFIFVIWMFVMTLDYAYIGS